MTPKQQAQQLFAMHYSELIDTDLGEEITVSIQAIKHAKITAKTVAKETVNAAFWNQVVTELERM